MCPCEDLYKLPNISFVGGTTRKFQFNIYTHGGAPADLSELTATLVISNVMDRVSGTPIIFVSLTRLGETNVFEGTLAADQTRKLYGKYIYQLSVSGPDFSEEPQQGIMYINANIDK